MSPLKDESSDTDPDDEFDEDMEVLKKAWKLSGKNPTDHPPSVAGAPASPSSSFESESDEEDLQLVRSIQKRFAVVPMDTEDEPLMNIKPLCTLPPDLSEDDDDDCEDDYATLRAIQRRFAAYSDGGLEDSRGNFLHKPVQVGSTIIDSEKETSNRFVERTNAREGFLNCVDTSETSGKEAEACDDAGRTQSSDLVDCNGPGTEDVAGLPLKSSHFPKSALAFVDAIKQNRSCQKLIRSKMIQVEARMEELNKLMKHVKILKGYQADCKRKTGRALSQKKDARVQLISVPKPKANTKLNTNKVSAVYKGPPENAHVAYYKEALATFAVNVTRKKWSKEEQENLVKGVRQKFQEMMLQRSVDDLLSDADGSYDPGNVDSILRSIKDFDITPDNIRLFLPKVNWEQLAAMYVPRRSGVECQARFLNFDDPLINHNLWTAMEDKNLLHIVQKQGLSNWINIASSLGTNRTPSQCLERYQRSLNPSVLKREWSEDEDDQLRTAVETYGESNWQNVASVMVGRTGTQCSNRWLKTLHPTRKIVGRWTEEEDKRLKVAVTFFGPKTWRKIARYVPGRTHVQSRERWVNCLDPSLNTAKWTEEEDLKLERAIGKHGHCWSKVSACMPRRTDNQCLRRWKALNPNEVLMLQAEKKIRRAALISNFVDRESERPALGPSDFRLPETHCITGSENVDFSRRKRRRSSKVWSEEVPRLNNGNADEDLQCGSIPRKRRLKSSQSSINNNACPSSGRQSSPCPDTDTVLHDMSNGAEIKTNHCLQNTRSSLKLKVGGDAPTPGAICKEIIVLEPHSKEYEHSDPSEECLLPTQIKKGAQLHPRRRNHGEEAGEVAILNKARKEKVAATNDHTSHFPDSMTLLEAFRGIKSMKRKWKIQETCPSVVCTSLAGGSICEDGIVDTPVSGVDKLPGKAKIILTGSRSSGGILLPDQTDRRRNSDGACSSAEDGSRNSSEASANQTVAIEAGDDDTISHFYDRLKKIRTEKSKIQQSH